MTEANRSAANGNINASEAPGREPTLDLGNLPEIAAWMASAIISGLLGNATFAYLDSFRRRFGRRRDEELKQAVYAALRRVKRKPNVSDADLRLRVEQLFAERDD